jgi:phosphohistidine phosphatase
MTVYFVQHGKSVPKEENPDRPLSDIGAQEVAQIANRLKESNVKLNVIFHTEKLRAVQTAEIINNHLNALQGIKETSGMNPKDDVRLFAKKIEKFEDAMYVGHLPFLEKLISFLITGDDGKVVFKFQNAGVVKIQYSAEDDYWYISGTLLPKPI